MRVWPRAGPMRAVVTAWEEAGAEFGWIRTTELSGGPQFVPAEEYTGVAPKGDSPFNREDAKRKFFAAVRFRAFHGVNCTHFPHPNSVCVYGWIAVGPPMTTSRRLPI